MLLFLYTRPLSWRAMLRSSRHSSPVWLSPWVNPNFPSALEWLDSVVAGYTKVRTQSPLTVSWWMILIALTGLLSIWSSPTQIQTTTVVMLWRLWLTQPISIRSGQVSSNKEITMVTVKIKEDENVYIKTCIDKNLFFFLQLLLRSSCY